LTETSENPEVPEEGSEAETGTETVTKETPVPAEEETAAPAEEETAAPAEEETAAPAEEETAAPAEEETAAPAEEETAAPAEEETEAHSPESPEVSLEGLTEGVEEPEVLIDPIGRLENPPEGTFLWGTGRRKNARARVRIRPGEGNIVINGKPMADYFTRPMDQDQVLAPLRTLSVQKKVDVWVNAEGGGFTGQSGAVRMGLGRALIALYPDSHDVLRQSGHLTRDPRMVERKKFGRHKARRGHQWGKR
jgi:small subunit ribosomal protein S9